MLIFTIKEVILVQRFGLLKADTAIIIMTSNDIFFAMRNQSFGVE
jgi:hypothetical protein